MLNYKAACGCSIGYIRKNNEDNFYFDGITLQAKNAGMKDVLFSSGSLDKTACVGVFDGMGGEAYGEIASYIAASALKDAFTATDEVDFKTVLIEACFRMNELICKETQRRSAGIIGTTAVVLGINSQRGYLMNIGDSKAYLYRKNRLNQISVDHTDYATLKRFGITRRKPRLTQHLGIDPSEMIIEPAMWTGRLLPEDRFLLCSDGLSDMISEREIAKILTENYEPADCVRQLINTALSYGGKDNITAIVCVIN